MMVAQKIEELLKAHGQAEVELVDMAELEPATLSSYPIVFIGSSTWGDGEYNDYSQVFFDNLKAATVDLSQSRFAIFGLGETFYPVFCGAVEHMQQDLQTKQAQLLGEALKIDGFPDENVMQSVEKWVEDIINDVNFTSSHIEK